MVASFRQAAQAAALLLPALFGAVRGADNSTAAATSTFADGDTQLVFSVNLPPNSTDVNFYFTAPSWYSWVAVGFGNQMAGSLMLVVYTAANGEDVIISPRLGTGDSEPPYYPHVSITQAPTTSQQLNNGNGNSNGTYLARGTCHNCTAWTTGALDTQSRLAPFVFAVGPGGVALASDDPAAALKRHIGYGAFVMDLQRAQGPGGPPADPPAQQSEGAAMVGGLVADSDVLHTAHGLVMAVATLACAPVDAVAATLLRKWPVVHMVTSAGYFAFVVAGMGIGIVVSREYIMTQGYMTPHQILGFLTVFLMLAVALVGVTHRIIVAGARRRAQEPPEKSALVRLLHLWSGRLIWVLLVINMGLGLQLDQAAESMMIGFAVLAVAVLLVLAPLYFCVFVCSRRQAKEEEEDSSEHQLAQLYVAH